MKLVSERYSSGGELSAFVSLKGSLNEVLISTAAFKFHSDCMRRSYVS